MSIGLHCVARGGGYTMFFLLLAGGGVMFKISTAIELGVIIFEKNNFRHSFEINNATLTSGRFFRTFLGHYIRIFRKVSNFYRK